MEEELAKPINDAVLNGDIDDDDLPMLSSHALAALKEFMEEQNRLKVDEDSSETGGETGEKVSLVSEDWRLSQFWYDPLTAETVAKEVIALLNNNSNPNSKAVCIACPTLYAYIKKIEPAFAVQLLEYDKRFEQYGADFTFYDYNQPEELPSELKHAFQVVVADPPYLVNLLGNVVDFSSLILDIRQLELAYYISKGEVQKDRAAELLGLWPCGFKPQHSSKLGNEFRLFTDYDPETRLGGWELEK